VSDAPLANLVRSDQHAGQVALITGASSGIGAGVARRLAEEGAKVVLADVDVEAGEQLAGELDGRFVRCDVRDPDESVKAVAVAMEAYGRLDIAHLNAGVISGFGIGEDFDLEGYRRAMGVNLDGVVFGIHAAIPALKATARAAESGKTARAAESAKTSGGTIVATASIAGIVGIPFDPFYAANKHAVVGLVRSLGDVLAADGIKVQALCPSYADTPLLGENKALLEASAPILEVVNVVDAFMALLDSDGTGECWFVVVGRESAPFEFRRVPGPRPL
jgi:NAD(P)-dependent dehydrogenase (short-subunit alcohol dehydrogenase family)